MQMLCKRFFDIIISLAAIIIFLPIMMILWVVVRVSSEGPVIFKQIRVGMNGHLFSIYKFRTMTVGAANVKDGLAVTANDSRVTAVGKFLRKTSLDELPQFFNILLGDISLVGPRPALPEQLHYYSERQMKRLDMRPGLTGLATINGRCSIPWSKRIEFDLVYIENYSLMLDLKILFKTVFVVLAGKDTYYDNSQGPAFDLASPDDLPQAGILKHKEDRNGHTQ